MLHHVTCCKMNGEKGGFQASMLWPQFEHFSPQDVSDVCFFHLHFRSSKVKEYHVFLPIWDLLFHSFQRMHRVSCVCELDLHGFATSKSFGGMKLCWCVVLQGLLERFDELGGIIIQARLQRKRCTVTSFWKVARKNVVRLFRNVGCKFCIHPW